MTATHLDLPVSTLDFQDPQFVLDPYPTLHAVRELGPIVYHPGLNQYLVTGYRDCAKILGNAEHFGSDTEFFVGTFGGETMECMDAPRHDRVRGVWAEAFQRHSLESQREMVTEVVTGEVDRFVARIRAGEVVDAVADMTRGIPTLVIARLLDIPQADYKMFSAWSDAMGGAAEGATDPSPRGAEITRKGREGTAALNEYIGREVKARRVTPGPDLISMMVTSPIADEMTEQEIIASNTQLVFAGNETTAKLMAHTLLALALHPDQLELLRNDRSLIPAALEEVHRWNSVVHIAWRHVRNGGGTVAGVDLPDGTVILCLPGVANRDPNRWDDPDRFDITRPSRQHMGFGFGMHSCIGLNLARLEAQIWLDHILDVMPDWRVDALDWGTNWILRGPVTLHLRAA
jgi:cytochrome P450